MADEPFLQNSSNSSKPHSRHQNHHRHHQQQQQENHHQIILHGQNHHHMLDQQQHQIHALAIAQVGQQSQQQQQPHSSPNVADQFASIQNNGRTLSLSLPLHQQQQQHHHLPQSSQQNRQQQQNQQPDLAARVHPAGGSGKSRAELTATGGHGRDDAWTEGATLALIDAWGERYLQLNRGNLKQKHWREVADEVNRRSALDENSSGKACKSDVQCKNRLDTLKKKYKIEKARLVSEGSPSKWPFFGKLEELVGPSKKGKKQRLAPPDSINNNNANPIATNNNVSGVPSKMNLHQQQQPQQPSNSSSSKEYSAGMTDSCDNLNEGGKKRKIAAAAAVEGPFKDLARAIVKFGEVYERIESAKQQQMMDLERQRMEFTKDLELQRMQLFMQTQVELAKLKHGKHGGSNTEHYL